MGLIDRLFSNTFLSAYINHRNIYLLGIAFILCGLSWSNAMMSIGQIILLCNAVLELNFSQKWEAMKNQPILWVLIGFILLHFVGLIWSNNLEYGLKDIRNKLPLIILPLIVVISKPLSKIEWRVLTNIYLCTLLIITFFSLNKLLGINGKFEIDKRDLAINISHIRYGLNLCLAIILILFSELSVKNKWLKFVIAIWFTTALILFELYSGILIFIALSIFFSLNKLFKSKSKEVKLVTAICLITGIALLSSWFYNVHSNYIETVNPAYNQHIAIDKNMNGIAFFHDMDDFRKTNGVYIRRYIVYSELWEAWNKRSKADVKSQDKKGHLLEATLVRYLASRGLTKDSAGVSQLRDNEIKAIENGIANYKYLNQNKLENRIHDILFEFEMYRSIGYANGYSLVMRWIYWKTAWHIIKDNIWFGVGTGDVQDAFQAQYEEDKVKLDQQYRRRSHNQYLSIWVGLGLLGLLYFIFSLLYPLFHISGEWKTLYLAFFLIATLSFLTEDTLETQAGVTFFAIFNSLLLLGLKNQDQTSL